MRKTNSHFYTRQILSPVMLAAIQILCYVRSLQQILYFHTILAQLPLELISICKPTHLLCVPLADLYLIYMIAERNSKCSFFFLRCLLISKHRLFENIRIRSISIIIRRWNANSREKKLAHRTDHGLAGCLVPS